MTKLESEREKFFKILKKLEEFLSKEKNEENRDSAIKRFEMCFDTAWKSLKAYLFQEKGVTCLSPKDCFKEGFKRGVIDYEDLWGKICDERNLAVHTYSEDFANALYKKLPEYLKLFEDLKEKIKSE